MPTPVSSVLIPRMLRLTLAAALLGAMFALDRSIDNQRPVGVITPAQAEQARLKERDLAMLRTLTNAGRYEDAIRGYEAFLARYPYSAVARAGREEAQRLHEETLAAAKPDAEVTHVARKPRREKPAEVLPPEPPKKPGRWERFKRWFRGS